MKLHAALRLNATAPTTANTIAIEHLRPGQSCYLGLLPPSRDPLVTIKSLQPLDDNYVQVVTKEYFKPFRFPADTKVKFFAQLAPSVS